jgi:hypothetical protein
MRRATWAIRLDFDPGEDLPLPARLGGLTHPSALTRQTPHFRSFSANLDPKLKLKESKESQMDAIESVKRTKQR